MLIQSAAQLGLGSQGAGQHTRTVAMIGVRLQREDGADALQRHILGLQTLIDGDEVLHGQTLCHVAEQRLRSLRRRRSCSGRVGGGHGAQ